MLLRLRAPLSLVAVFLLIALIGVVLIGGRLVQDWNAVHKTTPAGPRLSLQELEARPLHIPIPAAPNDCVSGPFVLDGYGSGPIHLNTGPVASTAWGVYSYLLLYADSKVQGPVLVRVVHLFYSDPVVFVGPNSAGPVLQKDTLDGKAVDQHKELFIDTSVTTPNIGTSGLLAMNTSSSGPLFSVSQLIPLEQRVGRSTALTSSRHSSPARRSGCSPAGLGSPSNGRWRRRAGDRKSARRRTAPAPTA